LWLYCKPIRYAIGTEWQRTLDIAGGRFEIWGEEAVCVNHGQINPANDRLALCAHETRWTDSAGVEHRIRNVDGVYPRLLLVEPEGRRRVIPPMNNYATHEHWAVDGRGFYYCSHGDEYGVIYYDLASGKQQRLAPVRASHTTMTADKKYFTYDHNVGPWYRGCAWQIGFYNAASKKEAFLYNALPAGSGIGRTMSFTVLPSVILRNLAKASFENGQNVRLDRRPSVLGNEFLSQRGLDHDLPASQGIQQPAQ